MPLCGCKLRTRWLLRSMHLRGISNAHFGLAQLLIMSCCRLTLECIRYFVFTSVFAEVAVGVWVLCCWEPLLIASFHHLVLRWRGLIKFCREEQLPALPLSLTEGRRSTHTTNTQHCKINTSKLKNQPACTIWCMLLLVMFTVLVCLMLFVFTLKCWF